MRPSIGLLFATTLLLSCETKGPSAETPVFVQKGEDVLLDLDADVPEKFVLIDWRFNKMAILVRFLFDGQPNIIPDYTGRIEFPEKKYSVILKNLQIADSGVYTAQVSEGTGDRELTNHTIIVEDPVSPVVLTVDSVVSRSTCNLTVSCRTQGSHINSTFRCVDQTCSQEGGNQSQVTTSGASLQVILLNNSIICNHSNHVSRQKDVKMIQDFCHLIPDPGPTLVVVIWVTCSALVVLLVLSGLFLWQWRGKSRKYSPNSGSESTT